MLQGKVQKGEVSVKKILVVGMILLVSFGIAGCESRVESGESSSEPESFVALQKDEIVTSENRITELKWEKE